MPRNLQQLYIDPQHKVLDPRFRDLAPEAGARGFAALQVKGINEDARTVTAYVSTPNVDRYEEVILPSAFAKHLDDFMTNPVMLAGHRHASENGDPTVIGHWIDMKITDDGLIGTAKFMEDDELAEKWWQRFKQRSVRAFSVGFIVRKWEFRDYEREDGTTVRLRTHTEAELIEVSAVSVPANKQSLVRAASALGRLGDDADAESAGRPSNRSIERVIREEVQRSVKRYLDIDSPELRQLMADVAREAMVVFRDELTHDLYDGWAHGKSCGQAHAGDDDPDGSSSDDDYGAYGELEETGEKDLDLDEIPDEDREFLDDIREALR